MPPHNDVDVFSQDLGFIAILDEEDPEESKLLGFNLVVGGGLGATHGEPQTYPRIGDLIGFLTPEQMLKVAETVVMIQRDFGDRTDRKHARLKYTIADRGVDWFKAELFKRLGYELEPPRPYKFTTQGDRFGWLRGHDGRWHLTLRIESGRVADRPGACISPASRRLPRFTRAISASRANQNLIIANVPHERVHEDRPARGRSRSGEGAVHHAGAARCAGLRGAAHLRTRHGRGRALSTRRSSTASKELLVKQD